jgi:F-type H+-transporting ATPase subunit b
MTTASRKYGKIYSAGLAATVVFMAIVGRAAAASDTPPGPVVEASEQSVSDAAKGESPEKAETPAHGEGEGGEINPLDFKTNLAVWTAVVFLLLLAILWKFAWGPLADGLDKREKHVADQIAQANEANQKAKDLLAAYEQKLADSQNEVRAILEKGRRDAEQVGRTMLDKAKADAKAEGERMLKQIDAATTGAIKELADRSATLAVELAGKIVHARLNPKDHAKLIEQAVAGFVIGKDIASKN